MTQREFQQRLFIEHNFKLKAPERSATHGRECSLRAVISYRLVVLITCKGRVGGVGRLMQIDLARA